MGVPFTDLIDSFASGVATTLKADVLPAGASPRGWNSALRWMAADHAAVAKRLGVTLMNATAITATPAIIGQYLYKRRSSSTLTGYHLLVTDTGRLEKLVAGSLTNLSTAFDATSPNPPDFETANNLCFIVNGQDKLKFNGTSVQNFGITAPAAPTLSQPNGGAMTGDYEFQQSYYNSATGHESSTSPVASITVAAKKITVTFATTADAQVDFYRLYIRKITQEAFLFRVTSGTGFDSTNSGWPVATVSVELNLSDSDILAFTVLAPDEDENDPPPSGVRYICWHQSRMFVADERSVYYSKIELPEAFDPDFREPVNPDDGQMITGLHSTGGVLFIFKQHSIYALYGDDPNSWYVRQVNSDTGATSFRSILTIENVTYWWSARGPMAWAEGEPAPAPIGQVLLEPTVSPDAINYTYAHLICAAAQLPQQRILFAVPSLSSTRNDLILPYSYRVNKWESDRWDPMDVASFGQLEDSTTIPFVSLGGYKGQCFQMERGYNDGVASGTNTGTFVAAGTSVATITDSAAAFDTTGGGLVERKVTVVDEDGAPIGRGTIASNTGTSVTMISAISGLTIDDSYTYYIGGPDFQWDTRWTDSDQPFKKKRYEYLFVQVDSVSNTLLDVDLGFDFDSDYGQSQRISLTAADPTWDAVIWTHQRYGSETLHRERLRVGRTGILWRGRFRQPAPDTPVTLRRFGIQGELQTTKTG